MGEYGGNIAGEEKKKAYVVNPSIVFGVVDRDEKAFKVDYGFVGEVLGKHSTGKHVSLIIRGG